MIRWNSKRRIRMGAAGLGALLFLGVTVFQNCSSKTNYVFVSNSASSSLPDLIYQSYGDCGSGQVGISAVMSLSADFKVLKMLRQDCQDLSTPEPIYLPPLEQLLEGQQVITYGNLVFDMVTQPDNQRITDNFCIGATNTYPFLMVSWVSTSNLNAHWARVWGKSNHNSDALPVSMTGNPVTYTSMANLLNTLTLTMGSVPNVQFTVRGDPTDYSANLACLNQPLPTSQNPSMTSQFFWTQSGWDICSQKCGGGIQTQTVYCIDNVVQAITAPSNCAGPMPALTRICNPQACP